MTNFLSELELSCEFTYQTLDKLLKVLKQFGIIAR